MHKLLISAISTVILIATTEGQLPGKAASSDADLGHRPLHSSHGRDGAAHSTSASASSEHDLTMHCNVTGMPAHLICPRLTD